MKSRTKHGKERQDKYYYLAKEQGYRARSAFKIIQLAKKFNIFENCNVLVDLCAAPGGWLQVASKHLPVSSIIIGVDLVPIRPIKGVVTIQADIRTQRCRNLINQQLRGAEVDVVLHDGAPNVGANWNLDAFNQNVLVIEAAKLASNVLRKGGIFVTKIFRSADYNSLIWTLGKCFDRVKVTKPSSSRNVSAEIFAVCIGFRTLKSLDPKIFNCENVFISQGGAPADEPEESTKPSSLSELLRQVKKVNKEGYEEGDDFREYSIIEFLTSSNPAEMLVSSNRFVFRLGSKASGIDNEAELLQKVESHSLTTEEIRLLCSDLKVAGRSDLQRLLKWRQKLHKEFFPVSKPEKHVVDTVTPVDADAEPEEEALNREQIAALDRVRKDLRRTERKQRREMMKHKKALAGSASISIDADPELFRLSTLRGHDIDEILDEDNESDSSSKAGDDFLYAGNDNASDYSDTDSMELQFETDDEDDRVAQMEVDLEVQHEMSKLADDRQPKVAKKLTRRQRVYQERGAELSSLLDSMQYEARLKAQQEMQESDEEESSDEEPEVTEPVPQAVTLDNTTNDKTQSADDAMVDRWFDQDVFHDMPRETARKRKTRETPNDKKNKKEPTFTVVPAVSDADAVERVRDEVELELTRNKETIAEVQAMGSLLINKSTRMALIDGAYNRRTFDDGDLPSWFEDDEKKHSNYELPVTKELMKRYRAKLYELKNRPIRKVLEARGRRKMRVQRKLKSVLPRVEALQNSDTGSAKTAKKLLRKVQNTAANKREKVYVVSRRGGAASTAPSGGKGARKVTKVVDKRMKKDNVRQKRKPKSRSRKAHLVHSVSICELAEHFDCVSAGPRCLDSAVSVSDIGIEKKSSEELCLSDIEKELYGDIDASSLPELVVDTVCDEGVICTSHTCSQRIEALEAEVRLLRAQNAQLIVNSCALYNTLMQHIEKLRLGIQDGQSSPNL
ncbi:ribosomal RNA large subunit methyltransferase J family protein [Babesia bovis T2Bo]|uniref:Putative rRNA methyltransferase n=1 Tax=Babesia bovis TaxID=5865 RepID=A7APJ4_BABBO|nr:ribosomal RNA large subunit methyltransferase J family protein [Babesia bovis T2Bo]EDO08478.1 ribosomal RNA large subunit methyltransferase J family protein [Babesia bovis T2Bo]|eukprot:XP_001612046.1 ribosomal RNA large subunit methyltransferase J family protein [Babesia bovis T2Bo]